jgi:hypothetical protein
MKVYHSLFLLILVSTFTIAQPDYSITSVVGFENPVQYTSVSGLGIDLTLTIYNSDDSDESDDLAILYLTDEMIVNAELPAEMLPEQTINIAALSSIELPVIGFDITNDKFRVGGNIVVIWPSYVDPLTDSIQVNVEVLDTLSVGYEGFLIDLDKRQEVLRALHQESFDMPPGIEKIEIYNLKGQKVKSLRNDELIEDADLPKGLMLIRVYTYAGTYFSFLHKVLK